MLAVTAQLIWFGSAINDTAFLIIQCCESIFFCQMTECRGERSGTTYRNDQIRLFGWL